MTAGASDGALPESAVAHLAPELAADYRALDPGAREVLDFWFGEPDAPRFGKVWREWFRGDEAFDAVLRARFLTTLEAARRGACDGWSRSALGALALVVVLDQFSRNIHRAQPEAFAGDARALAVACRMVDSKADLSLPSPCHRVFVYMPFEHDESSESQARSVQLFEALERETGLRGHLGYARRHEEIIARFGRFPHRNAVLGRHSTDEERAFLLEPGSSF
ncbi:MAG TPA: DUF924 family protein [Trinickia sp.]|jgi:uncharacterized protein (DUF924 family)|uniref:DUF924 family protein n=1 Tax=Trinickia sp. TaxID=2571163 RepID=UPI002C5B70D1|nr:DUF924 family protein [Trinickia sp.]HTI18438.1 DUF924 family protein [Trinickia sp.]